MLFKFRNSFIVGRGSCGIFLILRQHFSDGEVIVPANICYAAVYPVIYAGLTPVFCDVNPYSGNVNLAYVKQKYSSATKAVIVPHMYGNPVTDVRAIKQWCVEKKLLLIEDCASAMGAGSFQNPVGENGDYVLYSTGYSKIISLGYGGIVVSDFDLQEMEHEESVLPETVANWHELTLEFSKQYRCYRNSGKNMMESEQKNFFCKNDFKEYFIFHCSSLWKEKIRFAIEHNLTQSVNAHRNGWREYHQSLLPFLSESIQEYRYGSGAVPWRYSLFTEPPLRQSIIDSLLREQVPVSDWYPVVTDLFCHFEKYPGAEFHGKRILNFPLGISAEAIEENCSKIKKGLSQLC